MNKYLDIKNQISPSEPSSLDRSSCRFSPGIRHAGCLVAATMINVSRDRFRRQYSPGWISCRLPYTTARRFCTALPFLPYHTPLLPFALLLLCCLLRCCTARCCAAAPLHRCLLLPVIPKTTFSSAYRCARCLRKNSCCHDSYHQHAHACLPRV